MPCLYYTKVYLRRTAQLRSSDSLIVTLNRPHGRAAKSTIRSYVISALESAGVSATPGSTRSASSSRARSMGAPMSSILEAGDWSGAGVF